MRRHFLSRLVKLCLVSLPLLLASVYVQYATASGKPNVQAASHEHGASDEAIFGSRLPETAFVGSVVASPLLAAPAQTGAWLPPTPAPLVLLHMVMLRDGRVLVWDRENDITTSMRVANLLQGAIAATANPQASVFCAGHILLPDGRVMLVGGHDQFDGFGLKQTNIYNVSTGSWSRGGDMAEARWYPTLTELGDGRLVVTGGSITNLQNATLPEVYSLSTNTWTALNSAQRNVGLYPRNFLMPAGNRILVTPDWGASSILDVDTQTWTNLSNNAPSGGGPSAVMYAPGKVVYTAGRSTAVIDLNQPSPSWRFTQQMSYSRYNGNMVILPTGNVLAIGGSADGSNADASGVLMTEMWNPTTETWTQLVPMTNPRMYHATAFLLPNGSVLVAGGGRAGANTNYFSGEVYYPSYFYNGTRPTISSVSATTVARGGTLRVNTPNAASINKVVLIGLPSVTHAMNVGQRYVPLTFTRSSNTLTAQIPGAANTLPPGTYMLFVVTSTGLPSQARFIQVS